MMGSQGGKVTPGDSNTVHASEIGQNAVHSKPVSIRSMPPSEYFMVHRGDLVKALNSAHKDFAFVR
jgi:hypothetical protein